MISEAFSTQKRIDIKLSFGHESSAEPWQKPVLNFPSPFHCHSWKVLVLPETNLSRNLEKASQRKDLHLRK